MVLTEEQTKAKIRELNDMARKDMGVCSKVIQTEGIQALPAAVQSAIREAVEKFDHFEPGNDPYGEGDFGMIEMLSGDETLKVFWKIDYYDKALEYGSDSPEDPGKTTRVLTIMLSEEY